MPVASAATAATAAGRGVAVPSARPMLITRADLGRGWLADGSAPRRVPAPTCRALPAALAHAPSSRAASPTFSSADGVIAQQDAYRFATASLAGAVWRRVAQPDILGCVAASLTGRMSAGVSFRVTAKHPIPAPALAVPVRAYRVRATATFKGQPFPAYLDELVIETPGGRAVSDLSVATYESPPPASLEARLARIVARRGAR